MEAKRVAKIEAKKAELLTQLTAPARAAWLGGASAYTWRPQDAIGKNRAEGATAAMAMGPRAAEGRRALTDAVVAEVMKIGSVIPRPSGDQYMFVRAHS